MVQMIPKLSTALALSSILCLATSVRAADAYYPLITYKCDTDADMLTITNSLLKGETGKNFRYSADEGTYSPWDMVEIAHKTHSTRIIKSTKISNNCKLSSGEYAVILEPQIFSKDLDSLCGATISGAVTVSLDGIEVLERTAFEDYCQGNTPIITRITVFGKTGEYKIKRIAKYRFY